MGRPKSKILRRPKSKIRRETINTTIDKKLLELVRDMSVDIGIPINRLIENALRDKCEKKPRNNL
jgi:post-segregation antitoxin (ccd killing protein)